MHGNTTFGALTFGVAGDKVSLRMYLRSVAGERMTADRGLRMKLIYVCYAAVGFAVARWFFRREPVAVPDPVSRLRTSGLL